MERAGVDSCATGGCAYALKNNEKQVLVKEMRLNGADTLPGNSAESERGDAHGRIGVMCTVTSDCVTHAG